MPRIWSTCGQGPRQTRSVTLSRWQRHIEPCRVLPTVRLVYRGKVEFQDMKGVCSFGPTLLFSLAMALIKLCCASRENPAASHSYLACDPTLASTAPPTRLENRFSHNISQLRYSRQALLQTSRKAGYVRPHTTLHYVGLVCV